MGHRSHPRLVCYVLPMALLLAAVCFTAGMTGAPLPPASVPASASSPVRVAPAVGYDPMAVSPAFTPKTVDLVVKDAVRQRDIPTRLYCRTADRKRPS